MIADIMTGRRLIDQIQPRRDDRRPIPATVVAVTDGVKRPAGDPYQAYLVRTASGATVRVYGRTGIQAGARIAFARSPALSLVVGGHSVTPGGGVTVV